METETQLQNILWTLIEDKVRSEIEHMTQGDREDDDGNFDEEKINSMISDYISYNVTVSLDA